MQSDLLNESIIFDGNNKTKDMGTNYTDNETYRRIHFAVMAIESGARKLGISGKEMHDRLQKNSRKILTANLAKSEKPTKDSSVSQTATPIHRT